MPRPLRMTMKVKDRHDMFGADLSRRLKKFADAELAARAAGAQKATTVTRASFRHRRDIAPPRPGRSSSGGRLQQHLTWVARNNGRVEFDIQHADKKVPHWIIQEIGTGQRATIKRANDANPVGRPAAGATYVRTVKSQVGRRISGGLVFATGGKYSPPGARRNEQLHVASKVTGVPRWDPNGDRQAAAIRIQNEIIGQHFVKKGGNTAFREYQTSVLAAARQAFRKSNRP